MARVNVYEDVTTGRFDPVDRQLAGWFDTRSSEKFEQDYHWDGSNNVSKATGSKWHDQYLYRTKGGRWVLQSVSRMHRNGVHDADHYQFLEADAARLWLIAQNEDAAVVKYFGPLPEESGPVGVTKGRNIRIDDDLWHAAMARTAENGETVSDVVRRCLTEYVK